MTKKEFNQRIDLVNTIEKQIAPIKQELQLKVDKIGENFKILSTSVENRDSSFREYLDFIKDFDFSEDNLTVSDLFPGIRTAAEMVDPEDLLKKADKMKELAETVSSNEMKADAIKNNNLSELKRCLSLLIEFVKLEDQLFEIELDLLKDLDSPYDIGRLGSNT